MVTSTPAIAWFDGKRRFVGRYRIAGQVLHLDGTTTADSRERAAVNIPLKAIRRSAVTESHASPAARLETDSATYVIELVTGTRADAHALVESLHA